MAGWRADCRVISLVCLLYRGQHGQSACCVPPPLPPRPRPCRRGEAVRRPATPVCSNRNVCTQCRYGQGSLVWRRSAVSLQSLACNRAAPSRLRKTADEHRKRSPNRRRHGNAARGERRSIIRPHASGPSLSAGVTGWRGWKLNTAAGRLQGASRTLSAVEE